VAKLAIADRVHDSLANLEERYDYRLINEVALVMQTEAEVRKQKAGRKGGRAEAGRLPPPVPSR
jgi:hypothetical protein